MLFTVHTLDSAPVASRPAAHEATAVFGFLPNLIGVLAESPAALEAYLALTKCLQHSTLTPQQRDVVMLTISVENGCASCVSAHSGLARMNKVPLPVLTALRAATSLPDAQLEALRHFTLLLLRKRGWLDNADLQAFLDAGFTRAHVLDVITMVAMKTLSNYTNHVADTPLDPAFHDLQWKDPEPRHMHAR